MDARQLTALHDDLAELARRSVELGAAAHDEQARRTPAPPPAHKGRIVVVGSSHGLARFMAYDFECQGFDTALIEGTVTEHTLRDLADTDSVVHVGPFDEGRSVVHAAARVGLGHVVTVTAEGAGWEAVPPVSVGDGTAVTVLHIGTPYGPSVVEPGSLLADFVESALLQPSPSGWPTRCRSRSAMCTPRMCAGPSNGPCCCGDPASSRSATTRPSPRTTWPTPSARPYAGCPSRHRTVRR